MLQRQMGGHKEELDTIIVQGGGEGLHKNRAVNRAG